MKYAYSQKWISSGKYFSVEVFHWKPDMSGTTNYWTITANIQPGHTLYKQLVITFQNKKNCFEQLGSIIPFFEDYCTSFDKTRFAIKIANEYTDAQSTKSSDRKDVQHIFNQMDALFYFLQGGNSCQPRKQ